MDNLGITIIGYIYKITNKINDKIYIGQTKALRQKHGKIINFTIQDRFKEHLNNCKKKFVTKKLYKAMKELSPDNFEIILIENVYDDINLLDKKELEHIKNYDSINSGYNETFLINRYDHNNNKLRIEKIKKSMKIKWETDLKYKKITNKANQEAVKKRALEGTTRKKENKDLPHNIYKHTRKDKKVGYDIRILRNGVYKITSVTKSISLINENNLEDVMKELLQKAIIKRDSLIKKLESENVVNISNDLNNPIPQKKVTRYSVKKKFKKKINCRTSFLKKKDHNNEELPMYITRIKQKTNEGYCMHIKNKKNNIKKTFVNSNISMDEKLNNAKTYLKQILLEINGQSAGGT